MKNSLCLTIGIVFLLIQDGLSQSLQAVINHDGHERSYVVHIPENKDANTPMPLLIALHGADSNATDFEEWTGFS